MTRIYDLLAPLARATEARFPFYWFTEVLRRRSAPAYGGQTRTMRYEGVRIQVEPSRYVGGKLWWAKGRERPMMRWAHKHANPGLFVDVGACLGEWSLYMRRRGRNVLAFEPDELYARRLRDLGVDVVAAGLGAAVGAAAAQFDAGNEGATRLIGGATIPILPMDNLDVPKVSLLKVDVEGMELDVLMGARGILERDRPTIVVEDNKNGAVEWLLDEMGYVGAVRVDANVGMLPADVPS